MKKLLITLLAALLASGAFAQSAFPDIPENHWAGDAVAEIAELGIVIGFPDGTFRGNEAFTRYQAALVVSRLLDVLNRDFDARMAMSEEGQASLRNALQELASDVASQGVRLSAVEGSVASLGDDVMANQARLDELESRLQNLGESDPDVIRDLLNQLASQRVSVDTAQAQAEAAEALANDALDAANAASARARQNAEAIAALNSVVQGLGDRLTALEQAGGQVVEGGPGLPAGLLDRVARNEADIANIREFVILLRRDQVALRDRVSALEASDAIQSAELAALGDRVTALEENPLGLSGSISVDYRVERLIGGAFDVDRAYGLNNRRDMGASVFSTGTSANAVTANNSVDAPGERAQDRADIRDLATETPVTATLNLAADFGNLFDSAGSPNALNQFSSAVSIELRQAFGLCGNAACTAAQMFNGYVFAVDEFTLTFDPIGGDPLTFTYGEQANVQFTPYVFELENEPGFVATFGAPDFLAFLDPTLTLAHSGQDTDAAGTPGAGQLDYFKTGVRLTLSPFEGFTLGASYGQAAANAADKDDVNADNITNVVYGVDGTASLAIFDLAFEYAMATETNSVAGTTANRGVLYVELGVDASGLPLIDQLSVNYRDIPADWFSATAPMTNFGITDADSYPYALDQAGFKVEAGLALFILDVDAYYDMYNTGAVAGTVTAFGVQVGADLFAGFVLTGFYDQISVGGTVVDSAAAAGVRRDDAYRTGFGVALEHDGAADNALISGLNLEFSYGQFEADFSRTEINAAADMDFEVSILTLTPYVQYMTVNDTDVGSDDTNTIRVGTGLATDPLGVFFAPSLEAAVNYRTTTHSDAAAYVASEMQWSVGLVFNEFLFDNSRFTAKYGSWTGTNVSVADAGGEGATDISAGDVMNGLTQTVSGYELIWNYFDLEMAYGVYVANEGAGASSGQVFSIAYEVDF